MTKDHVSIWPPKPVIAGSHGAWQFVFQLGQPLRRHDAVEVIFQSGFATNAWTLPQTTDPTAPGFVTAGWLAQWPMDTPIDGETTRRGDANLIPVTNNMKDLQLVVTPKPKVREIRSQRYHVLTCIVEADELPAGSYVVLTYGDRSGGSWGAKAQPVSRRVCFPAQVCRGDIRRWMDYANESPDRHMLRRAGMGQETPLKAPIDVIGGEAVRLHGVVPGLIPTGKTMFVRVAGVDRYGNGAPSPLTGPFYVTLLNAHRQPVSGKTAVIDNVVEHPKREWEWDLGEVKPGFYYVAITDLESGLASISNPVRVVDANDPRAQRLLFWGDPHAHSQLSDGVFTPDEHYRYARHVAGLDFAAVTDHGPTSPQVWHETLTAVERWDDPGRFLAIPAHEPALTTRDSHLSFPGNIYYETPPTEPLLGPIDTEFWQKLNAARGVYVPHHTHYGFNAGVDEWYPLRDVPETVIPVLEIYSNHGSSEGSADDTPNVRPLKEVKGKSFREALAKGLMFGTIAGGDYHELPLGALHRLSDFPRDSVNEHFQYRGGLTAFFAPELTRKAFFQALRNRQTYATTGEHIFLWVERKDHDTITIEAAGTRRIDRIEVIVPGKTDSLHQLWQPNTWTFTASCALARRALAYVRVVQDDGETAWATVPLQFKASR